MNEIIMCFKVGLVKLSGIRNVKLAKMLTELWPGYKEIVVK